MVTAAFLPGLTGGPLLRPMPSHTTVALSMRTPLENTPARAGDSWAAARRQLNRAFRGTAPNEVRIDRSVIERAFELTLSQKPPPAEMVPAASSAVEQTRVATEQEEEEPGSEEPGNLLGWRLALLLVTASWGANFPATKLALDSLGGGAEAASLFIAGRFLLSALVLAPAALNASSVGAVKAGAAVGGLCAFGYVAQAAALAMGSQPATCAFICSLQAVVVALITAWRAGGLAPKTAVAVGLAVMGIGFLELPDVLAGGLDALCLGDLVAMGQPIGFGTSYLVIDQAMKEHPEDELPLAAIQCMLCALATLAIAAATAGGAPWEVGAQLGALLPSAAAGWDAGSCDAAAWAVPGAVLYTGLWGTAATIWLQALIFKHLPAVDASVILSSEPLWAAAFAALLLGDRVTANTLLGGALIVAALAVNEELVALPSDPASGAEAHAGSTAESSAM
eukprot:CAMPEP_0118809840 /NCGR_PEP_ID=MMETSP1162-20130426/586_1 /TAXON_ID=33656 /ORGANISM="Phaeocystis Sp, Strain CCMP2710" /LENGTH=451 /DNA_ID=CAMNT_0006739311 /DNA_START=54 /DNA_END=1409 /DNA_ORIENTATION=+